MTLSQWIDWGLEKWEKGRHPYHSWALCRQASRDIGTPIDHDEFLAAMQAAGYKVKAWYGSAAYFDAIDTASKREYQRKRYIGADDRVKHPLLDLRNYPDALAQ